jgi:arylsulfatase
VQVAQGRIERTECCTFSADEGADVGRKEGTPVREDTPVPFKFTGRIDRVTIEVKNPSPAEQEANDKADVDAKFEKDLSD